MEKVAKIFLFAYTKSLRERSTIRKSITLDIDFGKLNSLLEDPEVSVVECRGPGVPLKIVKKNKKVETEVILEKEEIEKLFSELSSRLGKEIKGPIFKEEIGNFRIIGIISKNLGPRFLIQKR